MSREQIAIDMALGVLENALDISYSLLMDETAKQHDEGVPEALNLIEIGKGFLAQTCAKNHKRYDDCAGDVLMIGSQINAIAKAYEGGNPGVSRMLKGHTAFVDVVLTMIELEGDSLKHGGVHA